MTPFDVPVTSSSTPVSLVPNNEDAGRSCQSCLSVCSQREGSHVTNIYDALDPTDMKPHCTAPLNMELDCTGRRPRTWHLTVAGPLYNGYSPILPRITHTNTSRQGVNHTLLLACTKIEQFCSHNYDTKYHPRPNFSQVL